jgi:hypothetical protein
LDADSAEETSLPDRQQIPPTAESATPIRAVARGISARMFVSNTPVTAFPACVHAWKSANDESFYNKRVRPLCGIYDLPALDHPNAVGAGLLSQIDRSAVGAVRQAQ